MKLRPVLLGWLSVMLIAMVSYDLYAIQRLHRMRDGRAKSDRYYADLNRLFLSKPGSSDALRPMKPSSVGKVRPEKDAIKASHRLAVDPFQVIALDPKMRDEEIGLYRDGLAMHWGLLFRIMNLSPEKQSQLTDRLTQLFANGLTVAATAADQGLATDSPEMQTEQSELNQPVRQEIKTLLGPDGYATFKEYEHSSSVVPVVLDLAASLPDAALTVDQSAQLVSLLAAASQKNAHGSVIAHTINLEQVVAQSPGILHAEQADTLTALLQNVEAKRQIEQLSALAR